MIKIENNYILRKIGGQFGLDKGTNIPRLVMDVQA